MSTKTLSLFLLLSLPAACLSAMAAPVVSNTAPATQTTQATTTVTTTTKTTPTVVLKEGQVVEILNSINTNEINAAKLALKKTSNPGVKAFAHTMDADHSLNLVATKKLAGQLNLVPEASAKSTSIQAKGKAGLQKLESLSGKEFDTAYAKAMVHGHEKALKIIDTKLLPNAKNPQLTNFLKVTRATVTHHLQMAEALQKKLSAK